MGIEGVFGEMATAYRLFRPMYPPGIIQSILERTKSRSLYVDLACGSGQLTRKLAPHFERTIATDKSGGQIQQANDAKIEYSVCGVVETLQPLKERSVSLITIAQALHWFLDEVPQLWEQVDRVLLPGGVLAVASYGAIEFEDERMQREFNKFYLGVLGSDLAPGSPGCAWQCDRRLVDSGYANMTFPYSHTEKRIVEVEDKIMSLGEIIAYLRTYSALDTLKPRDPIADLQEALLSILDVKSLDTQVAVKFPFRVITCVK